MEGRSRSSATTPRLAIIFGIYLRLMSTAVIGVVALISSVLGQRSEIVTGVVILVLVVTPISLAWLVFGGDEIWATQRGIQLARIAGWNERVVGAVYRISIGVAVCVVGYVALALA